MKILDLLAKLGILRFGTRKGVWHSGKDLPEEFLMNDVFNAKRDLTTAEDVKAAKKVLLGEKSAGTAATEACANCAKPMLPGQLFCTSCGHKK